MTVTIMLTVLLLVYVFIVVSKSRLLHILSKKLTVKGNCLIKPVDFQSKWVAEIIIKSLIG